MEKYIIILLILGLMYFVQTNTASSENFEGTSSSTIVDDWQAINALAQISADLMSNGGVKVPGKLDVIGNLSATGTLGITGAANVGSLTSTGSINSNINTWNTSSDGMRRTYYSDKLQSYYASGNGEHRFRTGKSSGAGGQDGPSILGDAGMILDGSANLAVAGNLTVNGITIADIRNSLAPEVFGVGSYSWKYADAANVCKQYNNSVVATTAQLTQAQNNGADWCSTGWVSDNTATGLYPITTNIQGGCGNGSSGIKSFLPGSGTAGVTCFGVKPRFGTPNILPFNGFTWSQRS